MIPEQSQSLRVRMRGWLLYLPWRGLAGCELRLFWLRPYRRGPAPIPHDTTSLPTEPLPCPALTSFPDKRQSPSKLPSPFPPPLERTVTKASQNGTPPSSRPSWRDRSVAVSHRARPGAPHNSPRDRHSVFVPDAVLAAFEGSSWRGTLSSSVEIDGWREVA